ncbi:YggW family oxidoreductase [Halioglobus japonicus]|uniref:Heme chaperone HemW n=1 Tax=Halioglobus japonicus TaxID=930805 RepID=A0AAP8MCP5_9GAMM|nr:radical SAM family heme chaperone HemW [Halioglobus japonicus]AQA17415.1 YggW family oxidoreductase [Halioglobus japonicus]PLW85340.1 YggW family oxidoreductase [Halioglobus japonicus]GHD22251.1 YggW family oxidoreductase [Halioglobus japonicus]
MQLPPLGLYIHLPWCERKCPYCDFNSHESAEIPEGAYIDALLEDLRVDALQAQGRAVQTLFIGGGTPSLFSASAIRRLMQGIAQTIALAPDLEATMEANPGSAEAEKFAGFRAAGINRLSLGVQSFDDARLKALGRIHDRNQALAAIAAVTEAGFDNFNIDLMHGLPGQDEAGASSDLTTALGFNPPHLSWYQLTIEPNTVFNKRPPTLPVEDALADIQDHGEALLAEHGMQQYEVSAYSKPGQQCRHNLNYWSFGDYLGIGAGAHAKISGEDGVIRRYAKTRGPADYLNSDGNYMANERRLDAAEATAEFMLYALRLNNGFSIESFEARSGQELAVIADKLDSLMERGLLERNANQIRPTALGRRFLDSVIGEFL